MTSLRREYKEDTKRKLGPGSEELYKAEEEEGLSIEEPKKREEK